MPKELSRGAKRQHPDRPFEHSRCSPDQLAILARYARLAYIHARLLCEFTQARIDYAKRYRLKCPENPWDQSLPNFSDDKNLWRRVVEFCLSQGLDIFSFIAGQFSFDNCSTRPPQPRQLLVPDAVTRSEEGINRIRVGIAGQFKREISAFHGQALSVQHSAGMSEAAAIINAFSFRVEALSPMFDYCMAHKLTTDANFKSIETFLNRVIAAKTLPAALQYIQSRQPYRDVYGSFIPEDFDAKAISLWADHVEDWVNRKSSRSRTYEATSHRATRKAGFRW